MANGSDLGPERRDVSFSGGLWRWVFQQGVLAVMLAVICLAVWKGVPAGFQEIERALTEMQNRFTETIKYDRELSDKAAQRDRQLFERAVEKLEASQRELTTAVREQTKASKETTRATQEVVKKLPDSDG